MRINALASSLEDCCELNATFRRYESPVLQNQPSKADVEQNLIDWRDRIRVARRLVPAAFPLGLSQHALDLVPRQLQETQQQTSAITSQGTSAEMPTISAKAYDEHPEAVSKRVAKLNAAVLTMTP